MLGNDTGVAGNGTWLVNHVIISQTGDRTCPWILKRLAEKTFSSGEQTGLSYGSERDFGSSLLEVKRP